MKLLRYGPSGREKPGVLDAHGAIRDLSGVVPDIAGDALLPESLTRLRALDLATLPTVDGSTRLGPCVGRVGKFIAIGLNYSDHAAESNMAVPKEPVLFMKATSCIVGPNDNVVVPRGAEKVDWEVELGIVIGREAKYVTEADALSHVAGYCVVHDVSERAYQLEGTGQWVKGKSADTFGPIGPWMVTSDEVPDWRDLTLTTRLNGVQMQHSAFGMLIWEVPFVINYVSTVTRLEPGDAISTGTPAGVGHRRNPQLFMKAGDVLEVEVSRVGTLRNPIVDE